MVRWFDYCQKICENTEAMNSGKRTVLITGGAGFIGHHLCSFLLGKGRNVICLDNFSSGREQNVRYLNKNKSFRVIRHDITKPIRVSEKIDLIFNLASPTSPIDYQKRPIETLRANTLGIFNVAQLAINKRAKLLQASTSEVYGDPLIHPQPESYLGNVNHLGWRGCYEEGKRVAETILFTLHQTQGLRLQIARLFNTYGPGMRIDDGRVIPSFICSAMRNEPIKVFGGKQTRSFCYVDDLLVGLTKLQSLNKYVGPVNLGNPEETTVRQLASEIIRLTNSRSRIAQLPNQPDDPRQRRPNTDKASKILHWTPKTALAVGLRKTIDDLAGNANRHSV